MDIYQISPSVQDFSSVDDLLDFSNDQSDVIYSSPTDITSSNTTSSHHFHYAANNNNNDTTTNYHHLTDFTDGLCVPSNDVAELEWLSNFVHDSFSDFPANNLAGTINYRPENTPFHSRSRTKRSEKTAIKLETYSSPTSSSSDTKPEAEFVRRCTHCASEKTPQWRTGPLGPKTLCNACGVRYKSGRLVPEYRPAASPTFVLTQHSNSHRKVMELRRQKEVMLGQQQQSATSEYQIYGGGHHHHHRHRHRRHNCNNYEVC